MSLLVDAPEPAPPVDRRRPASRRRPSRRRSTGCAACGRSRPPWRSSPRSRWSPTGAGPGRLLARPSSPSTAPPASSGPTARSRGWWAATAPTGRPRPRCDRATASPSWPVGPTSSWPGRSAWRPGPGTGPRHGPDPRAARRRPARHRRRDPRRCPPAARGCGSTAPTDRSVAARLARTAGLSVGAVPRHGPDRLGRRCCRRARAAPDRGAGARRADRAAADPLRHLRRVGPALPRRCDARSTSSCSGCCPGSCSSAGPDAGRAREPRRGARPIDGMPSRRELARLVDPDRPAGDLLVGATISGLDRGGSYADRWRAAFRFRDAGATLGARGPRPRRRPRAVLEALGRVVRGGGPGLRGPGRRAGRPGDRRRRGRYRRPGGRHRRLRRWRRTAVAARRAAAPTEGR